MEKEFGLAPEAVEDKLEKIKTSLIEKAKKEFGEIAPTRNKKSLAECFTFEEDEIFFWFNTEDKSTHVLKADLPK